MKKKYSNFGRTHTQCTNLIRWIYFIDKTECFPDYQSTLQYLEQWLAEDGRRSDWRLTGVVVGCVAVYAVAYVAWLTNTMSKSCLHLSDKGTYAVRFGNQNGERLKIILYNMVILVQHMDNMNGEWWGHKRNAKQKNQHNWISLAPDKPYISYSCFFFLPLLLLAHSLDIAEYFCFVPFIFYVVEHRWKYATSNWMKYGRKWKFSTLFVRVFESGW